MVKMKRNFALLGVLSLLHGCGLVNQKSEEADAKDADLQTLETLNENGLQLVAYDASLWGFILSAEAIELPPSPSATSDQDEATNSFAAPEKSAAPGESTSPGNATPSPEVGQTTKPDQASNDQSDAPVESPVMSLTPDIAVESMIDNSLISDDVHTVFDAPEERYSYIAVRKCLRLKTIVDGGLTAEGIYCLQVPAPEDASCESSRRLIRGPKVRQSLNNITNENLDLSNTLTSKLGFTYDSNARQWSKQSGGLTVILTPLRIAALSLESPCSDNSGSVPGVGGNNPNEPNDPSHPEGLLQTQLALSSRLAYPMKIAVDQANRTYIASASAGTASEFSMRVGRFLANNTPDEAFGMAGYVELTQLQKNSAGYVVRLDEPRNRIYVMGYQGSEFTRVIVALNMSGKLETSWGSAGVVSLQNANPNFEIDSEGRVYVMTDNAIKRLDHQGKVDATFAQQGTRTFDANDNSPSSFTIKGDSFYVLVEANDRNTVNLLSGKFTDNVTKTTAVVGLAGDDMQSNQLAASDDMVVAYGRKMNSLDQSDGYWAAAFGHDGSLLPGFGAGGIIRANEGSSQNDVVFDTPKSFWMSGWNGSIRHFDASGKLTKHVFSNYIYLGADALALAPDGYLVGANVAHGGGDLFRASPAFIASFK